MSSEQTSTEPAHRPRRLFLATLVCVLEALALVVGGLYVLVRGLAGSGDQGDTATVGLMLVVLGAIPGIAARGLWRLRRWSRGPAVITQLMGLPVAWTLLKTDSMFIPGGIALAAASIAGLVCLLNKETTETLGIRAPSDAAS
ncbi:MULTISPECIES: hypothetical protein [unclassified Streptomyces]|uniref:Integral membrane protein n=1 Tax=Streptomyces evansiae TaxID=3075535 RepID=A0ABU2R585_9ACTN|nr:MULTISPECIES: hypothetical protein [unclassified Streptomyces]MYQ57212.1 hypothetical protein [Streptomyces sp. SID4926]MYR30640.1 hypothetical protein [Streptomyces sp. SID4945]MYX22783.1 hypothetical protein [Streptomyces sp. SID8380]ASY32828.1 hypothetical protein CAC01_09110 [Streptomyces sp. CLI2509]EFL02570.1 integral membrane protein [Streptomyces sp. SPB78]